MPMGGWTTYCPPYAAPRRLRRAVAPTACRSMPGVSDRPEKRFRYSAVAPGAVPLSGGGIDTLRRVVKPINASCAGRAGVDAYRVRPYGCLRPSRLIRPCEVQILTRSNLPPRSCRRRGWLSTNTGVSLTGCDGWPYPSQRSTVGGEKQTESKSKANQKQTESKGERKKRPPS